MTYDLNTPSIARLWRYQPDWSAGYEVTRSFRTDIFTSRNDTEQRRALRDVPRLAARYRTVVQDDDRQAANHFLRAWQNKPTAVPDFARYSALTGSSLAGASTLTHASPPAWIAAGQLLVLCGAELELIEVVSVVGATVTLADPLANAWPSGSIIRPAIFGLLTGQLASTRFHRGAAQLSVQIDAYPGGEPPEAQGTADTTFNGYEVFTAEPNWAGSPPLNYIWPVEPVDYGIGRTAQFRPIEVAQRLVEAEFTGLAPSAAQAIEQAFLRAKGRRGAFYRPTTEKDFTLAATAASASSTFLHSGTDLADDFGSIDYAEEPAAIEVCKTDGTRLHRLITDIAVSGGNSLVTVSSAWPSNLTTSNVARISWMPLVRFASDDLTTAWRSPMSATIRTAFQSVRA